MRAAAIGWPFICDIKEGENMRSSLRSTAKNRREQVMIVWIMGGLIVASIVSSVVAIAIKLS